MMYGQYTVRSSSGAGLVVVAVIIGILVIVGAIVLHFTFLSDRNEGKYTGFLGWLYDFLTFRKLWIEGILRILYMICAFTISIGAIVMLFVGDGFGQRILSFLGLFIFGNLIFRLLYELSLMTVLLCKNVISINKKLGNKEKGPGYEDGGERRGSRPAPGPSPAPARRPVQRNASPVQRPVSPASPAPGAAQRPVPPTSAAPTGSQRPVPPASAASAGSQRPVPPASAAPTASQRGGTPVSQGEPVAAPRAKFCRNCGTRISPDEAFCPNCGNPR